MSPGLTYFRDLDDRPLQQGDVVLAPVAWLADPRSAEARSWNAIERDRHLFPFGDEPEFKPVEARAGYSPAIVVTHDCQLDKEFLIRRRDLIREGAGPDVAERLAEDDPTLDRFLQVSPLLPVTEFRSAAQDIERQSVTGVFWIPPLLYAGSRAAAADLMLRTTIDRALIVRRVASLTDEARALLRYAIARVDAFRSPTLGREIEVAIGKTITDVRKVRDNPLQVVLDLSDGSSLTLVQEPAPVGGDGPSRRRVPRPV